jgi:hypothetical protein
MTVLYAKLSPGDDLAKVKYREIDPHRCPHLIFVGKHYRDDGSCKCDDPKEHIMRAWGYKWSRLAKSWVAK